MTIRLLFNFSAVVEVLTGISMLVAPGFVVGLLLGDGLSPIGIAVARILGIGLLSLGVSAWENPQQENRVARIGICVYNLGVAVLLGMLGTIAGMIGILLWPGVAFHGLIGAAMLAIILGPSLGRPAAD
jgi:hypothetical protein